MSKITEWLCTRRSGRKATIQDLTNLKNYIMSAISDFATAVNAHLDKIDAAHQGIASDLTALKAEIEALKAALGDIGPENQALLDGVLARVSSIEVSLTNLDAEHPPAPPVEG